jgi:hypothetical protein
MGMPRSAGCEPACRYRGEGDPRLGVAPSGPCVAMHYNTSEEYQRWQAGGGVWGAGWRAGAISNLGGERGGHRAFLVGSIHQSGSFAAWVRMSRRG